MEQLFKIAKAWFKVISGETTVEHIKRAEICNGCNMREYKKYTDFINDELKEVKGYICKGCGCPLISKIRSTDDCPRGKW